MENRSKISKKVMDLNEISDLLLRWALEFEVEGRRKKGRS